MSTETIVETPEVFDVSVLTRDEAIKQFAKDINGLVKEAYLPLTPKFDQDYLLKLQF